mgnify:CR=1 FL=1|tara:strand:- start:43 stop:477 length:435 start_codon:yes stop_codon:yes gene_type:complete
MNELLQDLYQEIILDHGSKPRNFGECENHNKSANGHNPLCGDKLFLTFILNEDNIIEDMKFSGEGCAISIASASLMTENLKGKHIKYAESLFTDFTNLIKGDDTDFTILDEDNSLFALKGVSAFPMRVKCATMAWHAFKSAVDK